MLITIVILGFVVVWFVLSQRHLVSLDELCGNSLSQIGVQQSSRWDALTALAQLTKNYSEHEYQTLMDCIGARQHITAGSSTKDAEIQENMLTEAMGHLMAVAEAYPDLKAQQVYIQTMDNVKDFENKVRQSRMVFNDSVTKFNRVVRQIPVCFIAGILGFKVREYLQEDADKTAMPSMS